MNGQAVGRVWEVRQESVLRTGAALTNADRAKMGIEPGENGTIRELYVLAVVRLPKGQIVPKGTTAQIGKSITGMRELALLPGPSQENVLDEATKLEPLLAREAPGLEDITRNVNDLIEKIKGFLDGGNAAMADVRALLKTINEKVEAIDAVTINAEITASLTSLKNTIQTVEARIDPIADDVQEAASNINRLTAGGVELVDEVRGDVGEILATLKDVSTRLDAIMKKAEPKIDTLLDDLNRTGKNLANLSTEFGGIGPDARRILGELGEDADAFMKTVSDMAHNLLDASEDLRAHPWKLLNEPEKDQIAFENLRNAMLVYSRAMRDMDEVSRRLKEILAQPDVGSPEVRDRLKQTMGEFRASTDRVRNSERRFRELLRQGNVRAPR
jgi:ABC-type transporter Mla subunit MlaD